MLKIRESQIEDIFATQLDDVKKLFPFSQSLSKGSVYRRGLCGIEAGIIILIKGCQTLSV